MSDHSVGLLCLFFLTDRHWSLGCIWITSQRIPALLVFGNHIWRTTLVLETVCNLRVLQMGVLVGKSAASSSLEDVALRVVQNLGLRPHALLPVLVSLYMTWVSRRNTSGAWSPLTVAESAIGVPGCRKSVVLWSKVREARARVPGHTTGWHLRCSHFAGEVSVGLLNAKLDVVFKTVLCKQVLEPLHLLSLASVLLSVVVRLDFLVA